MSAELVVEQWHARIDPFTGQNFEVTSVIRRAVTDQRVCPSLRLQFEQLYKLPTSRSPPTYTPDESLAGVTYFVHGQPAPAIEEGAGRVWTGSIFMLLKSCWRTLALKALEDQ